MMSAEQAELLATMQARCVQLAMNDLMHEIGDKMDAFKDAMIACGQVLFATLIPVITEIGRCCERVDNDWWQMYRSAGAPYGDTEKGRKRWLMRRKP
jgi:hypothetical protein